MDFVLLLTEVSIPVLSFSKLCGLGPVASPLPTSALDHLNILLQVLRQAEEGAVIICVLQIRNLMFELFENWMRYSVSNIGFNDSRIF